MDIQCFVLSQMAIIVNLNEIDALPVKLPVFDLANGALESITAITPSSSIPASFYMVWIENLAPEAYLDYVTLYARAHYAQLRVLEGGMDVARARKCAIVVAGVRAGAIAYYRLSNQMIQNGEKSPPRLKYVHAIHAALAIPATATAPAVPAVEAAPAKFEFDASGGSATELAAAWNSWTNMTAAEKDLLVACSIYGVPALVTQGWSLVKNGHHYLSNAGDSAKSGWKAIRKQLDGKISAETKSLINDMGAEFADWANHKALHPVKMTHKIRLAQDASVPAKLRKAEWGAAAVRLPAVEPIFEYPKAAVAVIESVRGTIEAAGGSVDVTGLKESMDAVLTEQNQATRANMIASVVGRLAVKDPLVAYAAGILTALVEASGAAGDTKLSAHSIGRVTREHQHEFDQGKKLYRDQSARAREAAARGEFTAPNIVL